MDSQWSKQEACFACATQVWLVVNYNTSVTSGIWVWCWSVLQGQVSLAAVNQICVIPETMNGCKNLKIIKGLLRKCNYYVMNCHLVTYVPSLYEIRTFPTSVIPVSVMLYSKTCLVRPLSKRPKFVFKTNYRLMQVKSIAECSKRSILQYFWPSLSYHLSLRSLFCLFLSGCLGQVLLQFLFRYIVSVCSCYQRDGCHKRTW